jgi:hypothetical protein
MLCAKSRRLVDHIACALSLVMPDHFNGLTLAAVVTFVDSGLRVGQVKLQSFGRGSVARYYCDGAPDAVT